MPRKEYGDKGFGMFLPQKKAATLLFQNKIVAAYNDCTLTFRLLFAVELGVQALLDFRLRNRAYHLIHDFAALHN